MSDIPALAPGDEITVHIPLRSGTIRRLRGVVLSSTEEQVDFYTFDSKRWSAGYHSALPEWVETKHRKHLLPTPACLKELR